MNKIRRIFHPVGQGAFYSERHPDFNIVYDCGNWKNSKAAQKVVSQAFDKNDTIDILFISHFDYDHVSMIGTLRDSVKSIKHVVLPLLHNDEKILLKAFNHFHANSAQLNQLIDDPQAIFGGDARIVYVKPTEQSESPINDDQESINLENLSANQEKDSGVKIRLKIGYDWIFIPYNYENKARSKMLIDELAKEGISIQDLENVDFLTKNSKKIKGIYEKIDGNINENSMIVYSGPLQDNHHYHFVDAYYNCLWDWHYLYHRYHHYVDIYDLCHKPACVYSGDADFNKVQIHNIFQRYWKNVGTIQVPHHGSKNSFNFSFGFHTQQESFICPVSFGTNNTYGHPSGKVLGELLQCGNIPITVTEKMDSTFIEIIRG